MAPAAISSVAERTIYISFVVALLIVVVVCLSVWWFGPFRARTGAQAPPEPLEGPGSEPR